MGKRIPTQKNRLFVNQPAEILVAKPYTLLANI